MKDDRRRAVAPPEVDWEHLDKKKFLMLGAAVFSVREIGKREREIWGIDVPAIGGSSKTTRHLSLPLNPFLSLSLSPRFLTHTKI